MWWWLGRRARLEFLGLESAVVFGRCPQSADPLSHGKDGLMDSVESDPYQHFDPTSSLVFPEQYALPAKKRRTRAVLDRPGAMDARLSQAAIASHCSDFTSNVCHHQRFLIYRLPAPLQPASPLTNPVLLFLGRSSHSSPRHRPARP
ncbi:uncharacterized protein J3D65DRAFT_632870, partial [Phyllosticta citribraziliensis]